MNTADERLDFAPPSESKSPRALVIASLAHLLLLAALTWGVNWKRDAEPVSFDAELWSAVPKEAAPKAAEVQPEPPKPTPEPVKPEPAPEPPPPPPPPPVKAKPLPEPPKVDIALEKEKLRKQQEAEEAERQRQAKLKEDKRKKELEKQRLEKEKLEKQRLEKERKEKERKEKERLEKLRQEKIAREKKAEEDKKVQKVIADSRKEWEKRTFGLQGASGGANAKGAELKSSGPSASYQGKIARLIKDNTVFTDVGATKLRVQVVVQISPNGAFLTPKIKTPSSNPKFDDAVVRAIEKMQRAPTDTDGKIPRILVTDGMLVTQTYPD